MFDWVPTLEEVGDWMICRITGHIWDNDRCKEYGKRKS